MSKMKEVILMSEFATAAVVVPVEQTESTATLMAAINADALAGKEVYGVLVARGSDGSVSGAVIQSSKDATSVTIKPSTEAVYERLEAAYNKVVGAIVPNAEDK